VRNRPQQLIKLQNYDIYLYIYMFVPALKVLARSRRPAPASPYALSVLPARACQRLLVSVLRYHYDLELGLAHPGRC
jgi:hypothetical protein